MKPSHLNDLLSAAEVGARVNRTARRILQLAALGKIPHTRLGTSKRALVLFSLGDLPGISRLFSRRAKAKR